MNRLSRTRQIYYHEKSHTATDYEPTQRIGRTLQLISWPIEKMLYCKDQALKKGGEKSQKVVEMKKKSCCCKSKLFLFVAFTHLEKSIFDTYKIRFYISEPLPELLPKCRINEKSKRSPLLSSAMPKTIPLGSPTSSVGSNNRITTG